MGHAEVVPKQITQRELRDYAPSIMREVESGESFVLTRDGTPIADIVPHAGPAEPRRVTGADLLAAAAALPAVDADQFFADLDVTPWPDSAP